MERGRGSSRRRIGLDMYTVPLTVMTLLSRLITREFNAPINCLRTSYVRIEPYAAKHLRSRTDHLGAIVLPRCYSSTSVL
eukprot:7074076-Pyramimonas_sp.AAC.1